HVTHPDLHSFPTRRSSDLTLAEAGARLALTYQNERLERNVRQLAETLPGALLLPLDVTDDGQIDAVFEALSKEFGRLDFLIHARSEEHTSELQSRENLVCR